MTVLGRWLNGANLRIDSLLWGARRDLPFEGGEPAHAPTRQCNNAKGGTNATFHKVRLRAPQVGNPLDNDNIATMQNVVPVPMVQPCATFRPR